MLIIQALMRELTVSIYHASSNCNNVFDSVRQGYYTHHVAALGKQHVFRDAFWG